MSDRDDNEDFDSDRTAYVAFHSSAIAGFKAQKAKYNSPEAYAEEVNDFADAVAAEAFARYKDAEAEGFPYEPLDEEEEEDEDEDPDERPTRGRRRR
jgi:hypothetical protein